MLGILPLQTDSRFAAVEVVSQRAVQLVVEPTVAIERARKRAAPSRS